MYRRYEDPYALEKMLEEVKQERSQIVDKLSCRFALDAFEEEDLYYELAAVDETINELKERINFAWQDQEAEENGWD